MVRTQHIAKTDTYSRLRILKAIIAILEREKDGLRENDLFIFVGARTGAARTDFEECLKELISGDYVVSEAGRLRRTSNVL